VFTPKGILSPSPLQAPIEVKLHTGQAAGFSNGVNKLVRDMERAIAEADAFIASLQAE
jgi:hypothetical protein